MTALSCPPSRRLPLAQPARTPPAPAPVRRLRVGLLGGSFNPAHAGHRYVSVEALRRLGLDQVWWLVSPQNPLKPVAGMAPLDERLAGAREVAAHPRIKVTAVEERLRTRYTVDTVKRLQAWHGHDFVWLLGADNLAQLPRWRRWRRFLETCPVAVFERHPYSYPALAGAAAAWLGPARVKDESTMTLAAARSPAWAFVRVRPHPASATALRAGKAGG